MRFFDFDFFYQFVTLSGHFFTWPPDGIFLFFLQFFESNLKMIFKVLMT